MRRVLISLFWNPARTARSCWYPEGEIVKSDKSPSQIRDRKFRIGRMVVQLQISDLGFKMQDSSDFKIPRIGARLVKYVDPLAEEGWMRQAKRRRRRGGQNGKVFRPA